MPPPRLSSGSSIPCSSRSAPSRPTTRWAATSKPDVSKICEPMWECTPDELQRRRGEHATYRLVDVTVGQREAELLVLVRGRDELVGVRLDADRGAHEHPHGRTSLPWRAPRGVRSRRTESTTMRPTPASSAADSSATDLLLPCSSSRSPGNPACTRDGELAAGADVEAEPLLLDPARDRGAEKRLGRVEDQRAAERLAIVAAARAEVGLVEQERRCAVLAHEVAHVVPAHRQRARRRALDAERPDGRIELAEVGRRAAAQRLVEQVAVRRAGRVGAHLHPLGRADAEQPQPVGQHDAGRLDQPQAGAVQVGDLLVAAGQHPAGVVEPVVGAGELLEVARDRGAARAARPRSRPRAGTRRVRRAGRPRGRGRAARDAGRPCPGRARRRCAAGWRPGRGRTARRRRGCPWCAWPTRRGRGRWCCRSSSGPGHSDRHRRRSPRPVPRG